MSPARAETATASAKRGSCMTRNQAPRPPRTPLPMRCFLAAGAAVALTVGVKLSLALAPRIWRAAASSVLFAARELVPKWSRRSSDPSVRLFSSSRQRPLFSRQRRCGRRRKMIRFTGRRIQRPLETNFLYGAEHGGSHEPLPSFYGSGGEVVFDMTLSLVLVGS
jgi:hypothetical protein